MKTKEQMTKEQAELTLMSWADYLLSFHPDKDTNKQQMLSDLYEIAFIINNNK
jgi:replicative DNA helicase